MRSVPCHAPRATALELFGAYLRHTSDWAAAEAIFPDARRSLAPAETAERLGELALVAARAGAYGDALRLWRATSNVDRADLRGLVALAAMAPAVRTGLVRHYAQVRDSDQVTWVPEAALGILRRSCPRALRDRARSLLESATAMYSTCLFCNRPLGRNESLETFPVGRRLAFDAAKGRLWVVCPHCERWNLTPIEERWEAIEQAERLYHDTRLRAATDQIGLARLRDGTELVRIGAPLRPEFAAWRYGDQFGRRRRRQMMIAGGSLAAIGGVVVGGAVAGASIGGFIWLALRAGRAAVHGHPSSVVARVRVEGREPIQVRRGHLAETTILRGSAAPLALDLRHDKGRVSLEGPEAMRVAARLIAHVNRYGGTTRAVQEAVGAIEATRGPEGYMEDLSRRTAVLTRPPEKVPKRWTMSQDLPAYGLFGLSQVQRLALEMALHEEAERRALEGELAELERAWQEAEEIAGIADDLLVPSSVNQWLERMRAR